LFISLSLIFSPLAEISRKLDEFDSLGKKSVRMDQWPVPCSIAINLNKQKINMSNYDNIKSKS
ncbi:MAG: hypothetical protein ACKPKF_22725, partial [Microcystis panniformis]